MQSVSTRVGPYGTRMAHPWGEVVCGADAVAALLAGMAVVLGIRRKVWGPEAVPAENST